MAWYTRSFADCTLKMTAARLFNLFEVIDIFYFYGLLLTGTAPKWQ